MSIGRKMTVVGFSVIVIGVGLVAFRLAAQDRVGSLPTISAIAAPTAANAGEPQLTVSNRGVLLSWIEHAGSRTTLRFAERTPNGWTEPRTVASGQDWSVNAIDVPSVLRPSNGTLVAQWLHRSGSGMHSNDVRLAFSKDDGRSWARSFRPYGDATQRERLFASLLEMPGGALGLIWLNGGAMPSGGDSQRNAPNHAHGADHTRQQGAEHQGQQGHQSGDAQRQRLRVERTRQRSGRG